MAITRTYETKRDCTRLMINDMLSSFDGNIIRDLEFDDGRYKWDFYTTYDRVEDYDPDDDFYDREGITPAPMPMWNTWWSIEDSWLYDTIAENEFEIADLGFTIIHYDGELWGIGIDGAGYDFYSAHWCPLYDFLGFKWHDVYKCPECGEPMTEDTMNEYYICPKCGEKLNRYDVKKCEKIED